MDMINILRALSLILHCKRKLFPEKMKIFVERERDLEIYRKEKKERTVSKCRERERGIVGEIERER